MRHSPPIRLLVVDDHFVVRRGLAASLGIDAGMQVVAEADSGDEALAEYKRHRPDVVLMDLRLPEVSGIEAVAMLCREDPAARVIAFSTYDSGEEILGALQAGARAYLPKSAQRCELLETIRAVHSGEYRLPPEISTRLARYASLPPLTPREKDTLRLIAKGHSNKEIAAVLDLSEGTVKIHVNHLLSKLKVSDRTQAAILAVRNGLVPLD